MQRSYGRFSGSADSKRVSGVRRPRSGRREHGREAETIEAKRAPPNGPGQGGGGSWSGEEEGKYHGTIMATLNEVIAEGCRVKRGRNGIKS